VEQVWKKVAYKDSGPDKHISATIAADRQWRRFTTLDDTALLARSYSICLDAAGAATPRHAGHPS
jgi:hypothetical protein